MMKKFLSELREFAIRGNVVDLAVGVIIGTAFGKIVSSLVADILTPILGLLTKGVRFSEIVIPLSGTTVLPIGNFIQACFDFVIISIAVFLLIKLMNRLHRKESKEQKQSDSPTISKEAQLLTEIRDLLKQKG